LRLLAADGTAPDRDAAKSRLAQMSGADIERYLRGKSTIEVLTAYPPIAHVDMIDMPKVFRDGVVLPAEDPLQRLGQPDGYNHVPVIFGTNRDENKLFMQGDSQLVHRILWIIPRIRDERHYNLMAEYMAKMWKANGADEPATAIQSTAGASVFVYRFDWNEEPRVLGTDLSVLLGAAHAFEIPFVFGHFDLGREGNMIFTTENEPGRKALSAQMMSYWAEFAYTGAPSRGRNDHLPEWTPWNESAAAPKFMIFDTAAGGGVRMSSDTVTTASVLAAIDDDPRLPTQRDKCMIYRDLAQWSRNFTRKDYPTAGRQGCAAYPIDAYPWG